MNIQLHNELEYSKRMRNNLILTDVLDEIPIHIYKNLIKGAYDRNQKYVKLPLTRKRKPKKYVD